jgi:DAACS family dicarboxylate/amino acid:cation (Na+ or H+) symporter
MAPRSPLPLYQRILVGLGVGLALGLLANLLLPGDPRVLWVVRNLANPIGQVFLRLIFMVVIPLVFCALVLGVAEIGELRALGRLGAKALAFTAVVSGVSVLIGVGLTNLMQPGAALSAEGRAALQGVLGDGQAAQGVVSAAERSRPLADTLVDLVPRNPLAEAVYAFDPGYAGGGILAVMVFSLLFGLALARIDRGRAEPLLAGIRGLYEVVMTIVGFAMRLAPHGVAGLIFGTAAQLGVSVVLALASYVGVVLLALTLHQLVTYGAVVRFGAGRDPRAFFAALGEVMVTAFSTSSSSATLPTSLRVARERLRIRPEVGNFVLTLGATANQNGTALYEGVTVLFLAQFYGIDLGLSEQLVVVLLAMLAGVGTAGVPGGSLPYIVMVMTAVGVPAEGIAIILGVDRLLDMCRTVVNVTGDVALAAWLEASELRAGQLLPHRGEAPGERAGP